MPAPSYHKTSYTGTTNPAADIIALIEADLTAAGWIFVEQATFTQGATPRYMRVWRCPGAINAAEVNFYIGLVRNQAAGVYLSARAFEGYTVGNHTMQRPCITGVESTVPTPPGYVASTADFPLNNSGGTVPFFTELVPTKALVASTNYDVGVLVSRSYLVINVQQAGTTTMGLSWMLGLFDPNYLDSQVTYPPLIAVDLRNVDPMTVSGVSRAPRVTTGPNAFGVFAFPESVPFGLFTGLVPEKTSGTIRATRVALGSVGAASGFTGNGAAYRGLLYDVVAVSLGTSVTLLKVGDKVTIGSTTYTALGSSGAVIWSTGTVGYFFNTAAGS